MLGRRCRKWSQIHKLRKERLNQAKTWSVAVFSIIYGKSFTQDGKMRFFLSFWRPRIHIWCFRIISWKWGGSGVSWATAGCWRDASTPDWSMVCHHCGAPSIEKTKGSVSVDSSSPRQTNTVAASWKQAAQTGLMPERATRLRFHTPSIRPLSASSTSCLSYFLQTSRTQSGIFR